MIAGFISVIVLIEAPVLDILKWDKLVIRRKKHKAIMMFKSLNEQAPVCWF